GQTDIDRQYRGSDHADDDRTGGCGLRRGAIRADLLEDGKIRIIATGNDVASLRTRTVRVNLTSVNVLQNRRDAIVRFNRAYQETVAWMYSDPAALKHYAEYSNLPEKIVLRVRNL